MRFSFVRSYHITSRDVQCDELSYLPARRAQGNNPPVTGWLGYPFFRARVFILLVSLLFPLFVRAQENSTDTVARAKSIEYTRFFTPVISFETRLGFISSANPFFGGQNLAGKPIRNAFSPHLRYVFQASPGSRDDVLYGRPYQGLGLAQYFFNYNGELGHPTVLYLLQGARLGQLSPALSLFYEWNLGLSFGWKPYDFHTNYYNTAIGSQVNAYIGVGLYLNWTVSSRVELGLSGSYNHFSNGNTQTPNLGVDLLGVATSLKYHFGVHEPAKHINRYYPEPARRHFVYELQVYSTRKGTTLDTVGTDIQDPYPYQKFWVVGLSAATLYQFSHKIRAGGVIDLHYNAGTGARYNYNSGSRMIEFSNPSFGRQLFLGIAGRIDYILPFCTLSTDIGLSVVRPIPSLPISYQIIALKIDLYDDLFLNVGYRISDFKYPNFLMLGFGYRFNNSKSNY